jgi:DNA repair exonuclease SbcCD ATPase subunit
MKRLLLTALACCLCALTTLAQEQAAPDLRQLMAEAQNLRAELLQLQIEFQEWKLSHLGRELRQVQDEQQRLADEALSLEQELAALDQQNGATAGAAQEAVSEAHALRASGGARAQRLRARQEPLHQRLNELTEQWRQEETRRQQLAQQAYRLKKAASAQ